MHSLHGNVTGVIRYALSLAMAIEYFCCSPCKRDRKSHATVCIALLLL